jgi:hypothetical protein
MNLLPPDGARVRWSNSEVSWKMANQKVGDTQPRRSLHDLLGLSRTAKHYEHAAAVDKTYVRLAPGGLGPGGAVSVGREHNEPDQAPLTSYP